MGKQAREDIIKQYRPEMIMQQWEKVLDLQ